MGGMISISIIICVTVLISFYIRVITCVRVLGYCPLILQGAHYYVSVRCPGRSECKEYGQTGEETGRTTGFPL